MKEMNVYVRLIRVIYHQFETEVSKEARKIFANRIIKIYDQIDRYILGEEEDDIIYTIYSQARVFLQDSDFWEEPEFLPLS